MKPYLRYGLQLAAQRSSAALRRVRCAFRKFRLPTKLRDFSPPYKVHIGCGGVRFPGWVHLDAEYWQWKYAPDLVIWDVHDGLPFPNESCQFVYSEHFVEHLPVNVAELYFRECHRILVPGGVVRTAMPDLAEAVRQFAENDWRQPWLEKYGYQWIQTRGECLNIVMRHWEHQWLYDLEELTRRLRDAGFSRIESCDINSSRRNELCSLESRVESELICEAEK